MKARITRVGIVAAALLVLVAVNASIVAKERIKREGEVVLLQLAPVDPRSLMQGDYMALRFALADRIAEHETLGQASGAAPLLVDERGVATLNPDPHAPGLRIRYRVQKNRVWLGTNAYFFEEGTAARYEGARFGEFHVDRDSGEAVLTGLRNEKLESMGQ